jgi:hypothetical protein
MGDQTKSRDKEVKSQGRRFVIVLARVGIVGCLSWLSDEDKDNNCRRKACKCFMGWLV